LKRRALAIELKIAITAIFAGTVAAFSFLAPNIGKAIVQMYPELDYLYVPCLAFVWITSLPLFLSFFEAWLIVGEVGKDNTYCEGNIKRFSLISKLILADVLLYTVALVATVIYGLFHPIMYLLLTILIFVGAIVSIVASAASHYILRYRERNGIK